MNFCPKCGTQLKNSWRFCINCATPLDKFRDKEIVSNRDKYITTKGQSEGPMEKYQIQMKDFSIKGAIDACKY